MKLTKTQIRLIDWALWKATRDGTYYGNKKHFQKNFEKAVFFVKELLTISEG